MKKMLYMLFLIPVCVLSMLSIVYLASRKEPLFFLQNLKINGINQLSEKEIISKVSPYLKESLLRIDPSKVQSAVAAHPFVKEVRIKRIYPFSILIDVKEKVPSALWVNGQGDPYVLDETGDPYRRISKGENGGLYLINTVERSDAKSVFSEVNAWSNEGVLRKEKISEVVYKDGNTTVFTHKDPVEIILGKEEQKTRLKRALTVLQDAKKRGLVIKCIDARFERGAIIRERKG
ncbi:MAG TPA: FtsQ-type POTRA domain-containing protein [Syntrophorhabdaceae bacterium]|nr:FtsQ-type POTRA domain-containing protein [Syntrophorhabdaceae bacterium]